MPRGKKRANDRHAPDILHYDLQFVSRFLSALGKPAFLLLYFCFHLSLFLPYITGHFIGTFIRPLFVDLIEIYRRFYSKLRKDVRRYRKKTARSWNKSQKKIHKIYVTYLKKLKKITESKKSKRVVPVYINRAEILHVLTTSTSHATNVLHAPFRSFRFLRFLLIVLILVFATSMAAGASFYYYILKDLPSPTTLSARNLAVSTKIYDRKGVLLYTIYKDHNRTPIALSAIPPQMKSATLAVEDAQFYEHPGFSIRGIVRSIKKNIENGDVTGGSTITQQLVKNALLSPEKTFIRKMKEVTLAILVERIYTKDQILEMYLNEVPFGGTAYGVEEGAKTFFGKDIKDVNLAEAALLAGLPRSPTRYSPFGDAPDLAYARQYEVLRLMEQNGFITNEQRIEAESTPLAFANHRTDIKAPHFVAYIREILEDRYGKDVVERGGLNVTTSLDYNVQEMAEKVISEEVTKLSKLQVSNGAAIVMNPQNGEILAMVGSKDYFDIEHDGNVNVTLRPRQPGSSIKLINYAYALSHGFTPATMIEDSPVTFLVDGQEPYIPKNYENGFRGKITLRSALAESRNIPAVRVLYANGLGNMIEMGRAMGITTWNDPKNYGLSLTLGGGEVRLLDLARSYATVANYGIRPPMTPILKVTNYKGEILDQEVCDNEDDIHGQIAGASDANETSPTPTPALQTSNLFSKQVYAASESALFLRPTISNLRPATCSSTSVLDPRVAFQLTDILKDNSARSPSFGTNSLLVIPKHLEVAVKTGTSNDLRDNLAIGYTKDYVVAVWVGNNNNTPMSRIASGVTGATPIWNKILTPLIANQPTYEWPIPIGLTKTSICPYTGTLACAGCAKEDWFLQESVPTQSCNSFWISQMQSNQPPDPNASATPSPKPRREIIDLRQVRSNIEERIKKKR